MMEADAEAEARLKTGWIIGAGLKIDSIELIAAIGLTMTIGEIAEAADEITEKMDLATEVQITGDCPIDNTFKIEN